jgi:hypothetical protein
MYFWPCRPFCDLKLNSGHWYGISKRDKTLFYSSYLTHSCVRSEICTLLKVTGLNSSAHLLKEGSFWLFLAFFLVEGL